MSVIIGIIYLQCTFTQFHKKRGVGFNHYKTNSVSVYPGLICGGKYFRFLLLPSLVVTGLAASSYIVCK